MYYSNIRDRAHAICEFVFLTFRRDSMLIFFSNFHKKLTLKLTQHTDRAALRLTLTLTSNTPWLSAKVSNTSKKSS